MKYQSKPKVIDAMRFETNNESPPMNMDEICLWINQGRSTCGAWHNGTDIFIQTLEGEMRASCTDWIIKGIKGEFYPCKDEIFRASYEPIPMNVSEG